jgi:DNA-binding HxlR family transcriptional regulator
MGAAGAQGYGPALADAIGQLHGRWALHVVDALLDGPLGYNDLRRVVPGAGPSTLAQRLTELDAAGLLRRQVLSSTPPRTRYALTARGSALRPVLETLRSWAAEHLGPAAGREYDTGAVLGLFQEKWALNVMCALVDGPSGFNALARGVGVSTATLSQRLNDLEARGLVGRSVAQDERRTVYEVTEAGKQFRRVVQALAQWAATPEPTTA